MASEANSTAILMRESSSSASLRSVMSSACAIRAFCPPYRWLGDDFDKNDRAILFAMPQSAAGQRPRRCAVRPSPATTREHLRAGADRAAEGRGFLPRIAVMGDGGFRWLAGNERSSGHRPTWGSGCFRRAHDSAPRWRAELLPRGLFWPWRAGAPGVLRLPAIRAARPGSNGADCFLGR